MWKSHNIAAWLMMVWASLGLVGQEVVDQNTENNNNKASIEQVQKGTSEQLIWLDQYDYKKMLNMDIKILSPDVVIKLVFDRTNEIRKINWLKTLKYNKNLEKIANNFAKEKINTRRREDDFAHFDNNNYWPYERVTKSELKDSLILIEKGLELDWIKENLSTANNSVYSSLENLMNSKGHREAILSSNINSIWIAYEKNANLIVQLFANIKTK